MSSEQHHQVGNDPDYPEDEDEDDRKPAAVDTTPTDNNNNNGNIHMNGLSVPLSSHGEEEEDDDEDEDGDEDDWSRKVETDEPFLAASTATPQHPQHMESVAEDESYVVTEQPQPPKPLTLKEEAIFRERQRRIETERARWKRQFAQSNNNNNNNNNQSPAAPFQHSGSAMATPVVGSASSVAETVESTMVHPDEEQPSARLGFNMERFLRNSEDFQPTTAQEQEPPQSSVLMERFLNELVQTDEAGEESNTNNNTNLPAEQAARAAVAPAMQAADDTAAATSTAAPANVQRSVSFEQQQMAAATAATTRPEPPTSSLISEHGDEAAADTAEPTAAPPVAYSSFEEDTTANVSIQVHPDDEEDNDDDDDDDDGVHRTPREDEEDSSLPRGLTEADVQAMVATEEASIANAPPSDREELLSEVGELLDHAFGGVARAGGVPDFSQGTPTTAMESSVGDKQSAKDSTGHAEVESADDHNLSSLRPATPPMSNQRVTVPAVAAAAAATPSSPRESSSPTPDYVAPWSPPGKMNVSPLHPSSAVVIPPVEAVFPPLPTATDDHATEVTPLLLDVPPEIITTTTTPAVHDGNEAQPVSADRQVTVQNQQQEESRFRQLWKFVRDHVTPPSSPERAATQDVAWKGAWKQHVPCILPVLVLVAPTLWMVRHVLVTALCSATHVPLSRVITWVAYLPLHLAMTGQVQTRVFQGTMSLIQRNDASYWMDWLQSQIAAAAVLGVGLGALLGGMAWMLTSDGALALAMVTAQVVTCIVAGLMGPWIPFLVAIVVQKLPRQDAADMTLWMSPLGASLLDVLGTLVWLASFHVVMLSPDDDKDAPEDVWDDRMSLFCD